MTEETQKVSGQTDDSVELPSPTFSETTGDSPTSLDADAIVSKLRKQLSEEVADIVERKFKSATDKRFSKLEKMGNVADLLADLQNRGVEIPDSLKTEYRIRELEERLEERKAAPASDDKGISSQVTAVDDALAAMKEAQLDTNNAEFIRILQGNYRNRDAFDAAVARHIVSRLKPQPPASPAGAAPSPATSVNVKRGMEALAEQYINEYQAALDRSDRAAASEIRRKYRKLGVPVDNAQWRAS